MKRNSLGLFLLLIVFLYSCLSNDAVNPQTQFTTDTLSIKQFLSDSGLFASRTPEGVWYSSDTAIGIYPVLSDTVTISYSAYRIHPNPYKELDNSKGLTKLLSTAIAGLQIGLPRFTAGSYGRLYIPSGLAYGITGNDSVPQNATLLFKVNLLSARGSHFTTDTTTLKTYINTVAQSDQLLKGKKAHKGPSGIFYVYDTIISSNAAVTPSSSIDVSNYTSKVLNATSSFDSAASKTLELKKQIAALRIILPLLRLGTTVMIYVPSGYGYGSASALMPTGVKENSNLIYHMKLESVH